MFNTKSRMSNCIHFKCDVANMCIDTIRDVTKIFCVHNVDTCTISKKNNCNYKQVHVANWLVEFDKKKKWKKFGKLVLIVVYILDKLKIFQKNLLIVLYTYLQIRDQNTLLFRKNRLIWKFIRYWKEFENVIFINACK